MLDKVVINFTPTGMIPTKKMTPHVPVSVSEIIEDVHQATELGITLVHLHARDAQTGEPTHKKEVYGEIIEGIRKYAPQLVICVSLSGRNVSELELRADPLNLEGNLKPDMGSLTLSSLNFNNSASQNSPKMVQDLAALMKEKGIVPELEAFDNGMVNYSKYLIKKNLIAPPYYFNLLLGNIAGSQANLLHTGMMINDLPENSVWSLAGLGGDQLKMNSLSIAIGGGVRVGLEDNIWYDTEKTQLASNMELLKRIHQLAQANDREIMSPQEFRELMNLEPGNGKYGRDL
ncbi:3-keto-5-aminohexanoate cleavage protein [Sediminicola sp. 1XM1-17]|uniref:3-keto-5-aminohexanoate cleavage protein n=1 Tax=Sediminicola sp. 1XM1-17 TaxID=3127702 RepID=UPI0030778E3D